MVNKDLTEESGFASVPESYWISSTHKTDYPVLSEDIDTDVAIVGGGMVGIISAYLLKKEGMKVAVLEADRIVQGTTAHSTSKLTSQHNIIYSRIKRQMGEEMARQYAESNEYAIHFVENLIKEKNIDCDFIWQPAYVYTQSEKYVQAIADEAETAAKLGIKASFIEETPLPFQVKAAVRFDGQAMFHVRKYLLGLAKEIPGDGSHIFEQTRVVDVEQGKTCAVITKQGKKVSARNVIIASHFPCYDAMGLYFTRIYADKSYVIGIKAKDKYPGGMYINEEKPTRSLRSQVYGDEEIILVAGENHKTAHGENTNTHFENLIKFARENFEVEDILYRWSTQDCMTLDGVPYIGQLTSRTPNIYVATGFGKWGMTTSNVSAIIIRDLIIKGENPWTDVYNPQRFTPVASAVNFIVQNADVAAKFIKGKIEILPEKINVEPGEAQIIQAEGQRIGVYRDEKDKLHFVDTTCTHLGCELEWNAAEKTWDCPCHGSRFTYEGEIVEGPAINPLKHIDDMPNHIDPDIF